MTSKSLVFPGTIALFMKLSLFSLIKSVFSAFITFLYIRLIHWKVSLSFFHPTLPVFFITYFSLYLYLKLPNEYLLCFHLLF